MHALAELTPLVYEELRRAPTAGTWAPTLADSRAISAIPGDELRCCLAHFNPLAHSPDLRGLLFHRCGKACDFFL